MINRRVVRTILNATETTAKTNTPSATTLAFVIGAADAFYMGFEGKFASRHFKLATLNVNAVTVTIEYWTGSAWAAVKDVVDQTVGFTQSGFIHWENQDNWKAHKLAPVLDIDLYWIRLKVSGTLSVGTALQSVLNIFCDDDLLRAYYPELIADTRWLPPGRTDFLEQYLAAKDLVVLRLKQRKLITDESQVIDVNGVEVAAVHATAKIIMAPIATSDESRQRLKDATDSFDLESGELTLRVDQDKDGVVSEGEKEDIRSMNWTRR